MTSQDSSFYENVHNSNQSVNQGILLILDDILKLINEDGPVTYCPFCVSSFMFRQDLCNHLKTVHAAFLNELISRSIRFDICPFCPAKFFSFHLVSKHSLIYHGNVLFDTYFPAHFNMIKCLFCNRSMERKEMLSHIEENHLLVFKDWFENKFSLREGGVAGLVNVTNTPAKVSDEIDGVVKQMMDMDVIAKNKHESILKGSKENRRSKLPVRRELRFEHISNKENIPSTSKSGSKLIKSSPSGSTHSPLLTYIFQCAKCSVYFANFPHLARHVKKNHNNFNLRPVYQCAVCGANFFKGSYLRKHSNVHSLSKMR